MRPPLESRASLIVHWSFLFVVCLRFSPHASQSDDVAQAAAQDGRLCQAPSVVKDASCPCAWHARFNFRLGVRLDTVQRRHRGQRSV